MKKPRWVAKNMSAPGWARRTRRRGTEVKIDIPMMPRAWTLPKLAKRLEEAELPAWWISVVMQAAMQGILLSVVVGVEVFPEPENWQRHSVMLLGNS